jgi:hypothetical protein
MLFIYEDEAIHREYERSRGIPPIIDFSMTMVNSGLHEPHAKGFLYSEYWLYCITNGKFVPMTERIRKSLPPPTGCISDRQTRKETISAFFDAFRYEDPFR